MRNTARLVLVSAVRELSCGDKCFLCLLDDNLPSTLPFKILLRCCKRSASKLALTYEPPVTIRQINNNIFTWLVANFSICPLY